MILCWSCVGWFTSPLAGGGLFVLRDTPGSRYSKILFILWTQWSCLALDMVSLKYILKRRVHANLRLGSQSAEMELSPSKFHKSNN